MVIREEFRDRVAAESGCAIRLSDDGDGCVYGCVVFTAAKIGEGQPPVAAQLIDAAWDGRLALYTGAGLSRAKPSEIPDGAEVARRVHRQLSDRLGPAALAGSDENDLVSVADAVAAHESGSELIKTAAVGVADFTTAKPNYGHRVIAHLILEGVAVAITTNWDDCIERGADGERVLAVISDQDRHEIRTAALLKVHGCATKPVSALVTSSDLASPPPWARDEVNARLADSHTVFVGIGDIASYVKARILEARDAVGANGALFVVSPDVRNEWAESPWSKVLPDLAPDHRIPSNADQFLDWLGGAYVLRVLSEVSQALAGEPRPLAAVAAVRAALGECSSLQVLRWVRSCAVPPRAGQPVMRQQAFPHALIALGLIAGTDAMELAGNGDVLIRDESYELLIGVGNVGASAFKREADARLTDRLSKGDKSEALTFVVAGALGRVTSEGGLPSDILDALDSSDVVGGPLAVTPRIIHAEDVAA